MTELPQKPFENISDPDKTLNKTRQDYPKSRNVVESK